MAASTVTRAVAGSSNDLPGPLDAGEERPCVPDAVSSQRFNGSQEQFANASSARVRGSWLAFGAYAWAEPGSGRF